VGSAVTSYVSDDSDREAHVVISIQHSESTSHADAAKPLTDREMEILQCLPTRMSTTEIAESLHISPNTVKTHLRSIYSKLGVRSRNEAILEGVRCSLIAKQSKWLVPH
jgi:DNA-binding CsgD family transcriptional regulator